MGHGNGTKSSGQRPSEPPRAAPTRRACWVSRISANKNRSASSARRCIDAFRLSISCELIAGCASTSSTAATANLPHRAPAPRRTPRSFPPAQAAPASPPLRSSASTPRIASPPASDVRAAAALRAVLHRVAKSLRRIRKRKFVALFNRFAAFLKFSRHRLRHSPPSCRRVCFTAHRSGSCSSR